MTRGEKLLIKELKREMGSTEPLLEEEIERLNNIINEIYTKALDTSITSLDLRDYIINNLGSNNN